MLLLLFYSIGTFSALLVGLALGLRVHPHDKGLSLYFIYCEEHPMIHIFRRIEQPVRLLRIEFG